MARQMKKSHLYYHPKTGTTVMLRSIHLEHDLEQLYEWVHYPHTIPYWNLNKSKALLYQHFRKALEVFNQDLFLITLNGQPLGYAETYQAWYDRLANFCKVTFDDFGLHLLIGPPPAIGQGNSEPILCALTDYLFAVKKAKRVLVEPNIKVKQLTILERKLGFKNLGQIKLPEKQATLYAANAADFYRMCYE